RKQPPESPAPRRQLVREQGGRRRTGRGRERPPAGAASTGGEPGNHTGAREQADRPPEGSIRLGLLLDSDIPGPRSPHLAHQPLSRTPFARGSRGTFDRADLLQALAHPGGVGRGRDLGWGLGRDPGNLPAFRNRHLWQGLALPPWAAAESRSSVYAASGSRSITPGSSSSS